MVINMTKEHESRLKCICGLCEHSYSSSTCLYNKICDSDSPGEEQMKYFKRLMAEVVQLNIKKHDGVKITKKEDKCRTKRSSTKLKK